MKNMNPFVEKILGSVIRTLLAGFVPWLIAHGMLSQGDAEQLASLAAGALVAGAWSMWEKYHSRQKLVTAIATPHPTTEAAVNAQVSAGMSPSVMTSREAMPELTPVTAP